MFVRHAQKSQRRTLGGTQPSFGGLFAIRAGVRAAHSNGGAVGNRAGAPCTTYLRSQSRKLCQSFMLNTPSLCIPRKHYFKSRACLSLRPAPCQPASPGESPQHVEMANATPTDVGASRETYVRAPEVFRTLYSLLSVLLLLYTSTRARAATGFSNARFLTPRPVALQDLTPCA